jgi:hypothetical protein
VIPSICSSILSVCYLFYHFANQRTESSIWQYDYSLLPKHYQINHTRKTQPAVDQSKPINGYISESVSLIENIVSHPISSQYQRIERQYYVIADVLNFYRSYRGELDYNVSQDYLKRIIESGIQALEQADPEEVFDSYNFYQPYSPLLFSYKIYLNTAKYIFLNTATINCHGSFTAYQVKLHNEIIPFWQNEYAKRGIVFAEQIDRITPSASEEALYQYGYQKRSRELRKLFKEQCGIELR